MTAPTDHTKEVERRLAAIYICTCDGCAFFTPRDSAPVALNECWYCRYGEFDREHAKAAEMGFCKFNR